MQAVPGYSPGVSTRLRRTVLVAAVLPLAMLIGLHSAWAAYACRIDGQVRDACCCPKKQDAERAPGDTAPRMAGSCCCDITIADSTQPPPVREADRGHASDVPLVVDIVTIIARAPAPAASTAIAWEAFARPPPPAIPTYLANRAILR